MSATAVTRRTLLRRLLGAGALFALAALRAPAACARSIAAGLQALAGRVIERGDADYAPWWASMTWYIFKPRRYPDAIVRARSAQDVVTTITYAREHGLKVALRATGHNPAAACIREHGILLDTSSMQAVAIDPDRRTAWVEPGRRSEEFVRLTRAHDLAFPAAHTAFVGLGGYLLGGGLGWNWQDWDIATRAILDAELVLADGRRLLASESPDGELLWAARGSGPGFFAAVTRLKVRLFPLPHGIVKTQYIIPAEHIAEVNAALAALTAVKDRRIEVLAVTGGFAAPGQAHDNHPLNTVVSLFAFADSTAEGVELLHALPLAPLAALAVFAREDRPVTYDDLYAGGPTDHWSPNRTAVTNMWTDEPGRTLETVLEHLRAAPSPRSFMLSGWGVNPRREDGDSLFTYGADHYVSWYLLAEQEAHIETNFRIMDEAVAATRPLMKGRYVNEIDPNRYPEHVLDCYTPAKWERFRALRAKYDPDGVFHDYLGHG